MGSGETGMGSERRAAFMQGRIPPPSVVFKRTTSTPTHHCVRCHSQLVDGKPNLVGPQDKLPLTAGLHNGRTKEQIA